MSRKEHMNTDTLTTTAKWAALVLLWSFQYALAVPALAVWRYVAVPLGHVVKWALTGGALTIALLVVPIIGWLILLVLYLNRQANRRHDATLAAMRRGDTPEAPPAPSERRPLLKPWGLSWVK